MSSTRVSLLKIGTIYTLSNLFVKGMSFITTPLFARLMTQCEYGQFSSISSWASILSTIVTLDLYAAISVAKYDFKDEIDRYLSSALIFGNIVTLVCYGIVECNMGFAVQFFEMDQTYIRVLFLYLMFFPAGQLLLAKYRIYNDYKNVILLTWINVFVSVGAQIGLVYAFSDKLLGRFLGNFGIVSLLNILLWIIIIVKGKSFSSKYYKHALLLAVPLIPHVLSGVLLNSSDRIMINSICGSTDAALYSLAYTVSSIAGIFLTSINQAWVPWMYDRMEDRRDEIRSAAKQMSILFCGLCCGMMIFGPEIVLIFGGRIYYEARFVIAPVVFAIMVQFVYTQYVNIEFYRKKNIWISVATIIATVINIGLNFLLLPKLGYCVAAYTTIVGFMFMMILHYYIVKCKTNDVDIYDRSKFIQSLIVAFFAMLICIASYKIFIIRIVLFCIYAIAIFIVLHRYKSYLLQIATNLKRK